MKLTNQALMHQAFFNIVTQLRTSCLQHPLSQPSAILSPNKKSHLALSQPDRFARSKDQVTVIYFTQLPFLHTVSCFSDHVATHSIA